MRRTVTAFVVTVVLLAGGVIAQQKRQQDIDLQAAIRTETVDGDLNGAIKQYGAIVAKYKADRVVTAMALVHMAECYQKLDDVEAQKIYERLVRDYADQKEAAATARIRLGVGTTQKAGIVTRQVWTGPNATNLGRVSLDGRYIAFTDWSTGDLAFHDLTTGQDRRMTNKGGWAESPEYALFPVISRDGRQVAYAWLNQELRGELRISGLNGDGGKSRVLSAGHDVQYIDVCDWSPDDNWIAVRVVRVDRTVQLGLVSVAEGALRVLKSIEWRGGCALVSSDGKYLAYDLPAGEDVDQSDIYIIAVDGSRETPVVVHPANDKVLGWSPDGGYLLFKSDRGGSNGVWALPVADGRSRGEPQLIKADINPASLGLTRSGTFYYAVGAFKDDVYVASVDFETGTVLSPPMRIAQHHVGSNRAPEWSPDGRNLAYLSFRELPTSFNPLVEIQSLETRNVRELKPNLVTFGQPFWSPDGRFLVGTGADKKGRAGIYQVDAQTGRAAPLVIVEAGQQVGRALGDGINARGWSRDGKALLISRIDIKSNKQIIVAHDIQSGKEREFGRDEVTGRTVDPRLLSLSPDGQLRAFTRMDQSTKLTSLQVIEVQSGATRELLRASEPEGLGQIQWTPDGRFVVFVKTFGADTNRKELWRVPAEGGAARKIELNGVVGGYLRFHPDGRRIAFTAGDGDADEVWVMENFLPALSAKK